MSTPTAAGPVLLAIGDPHGYWRYAAAVLAAWRAAHGRWPDGILCPGDLGYFPDPDRLDKATRKHASSDPEQLEGMQRLLTPGGDPVVERLLDGAPPVTAVAGNHEAHDALFRRCREHRANDPFVPLDPRGRIRIIRDGAVVSVGPWRVAGIWGIRPSANRRKPLVPGKHLDAAALKRIRSAQFDLLLTHEAPATTALPVTWRPGEGPGGTQAPADGVGSTELRAILEAHPRALQLFGHYHFAQGHRFAVGQAQAAQLAILRRRAPAAAAEITGGPGAWQVRWLGEDPAWMVALEDLVATLPPEALGPADRPPHEGRETPRPS